MPRPSKAKAATDDRAGGSDAAGGVAESAAVSTTAFKTIADADWTTIAADLDGQGYATLKGLLKPEACRAIAASYQVPELFRSRIVMARHGFGSGEYQYFTYPLPDVIALLREQLYSRLAPIANGWMQRLRLEARFPAKLPELIQRCHDAGQLRPTPLLLRYGAGDYNCLHQDLYGATVFPIQVAVLLSAPGGDFSGGEFIIVEQRPRMQSRASVVALQQGDAVIFAVNERPHQGTKGDYRVKLRHGVSRIHSGERHTLGLIFHDAT